MSCSGVNSCCLIPAVRFAAGACDYGKSATKVIGTLALSLMSLNSVAYMTDRTDILKKLNTCGYPLPITHSLAVEAMKMLDLGDKCSEASYRMDNGHVMQVLGIPFVIAGTVLGYKLFDKLEIGCNYVIRNLEARRLRLARDD